MLFATRGLNLAVEFTGGFIVDARAPAGLTSVEDAAAVWNSLQPWLNSVELRQAEHIVVASSEPLFHPWTLENEGGGAKVESVAVASPPELLAAFQAQLTGGTVD
jgi:hypothetical protein